MIAYNGNIDTVISKALKEERLAEMFSALLSELEVRDITCFKSESELENKNLKKDIIPQCKLTAREILVTCDDIEHATNPYWVINQNGDILVSVSPPNTINKISGDQYLEDKTKINQLKKIINIIANFDRLCIIRLEEN